MHSGIMMHTPISKWIEEAATYQGYRRGAVLVAAAVAALMLCASQTVAAAGGNFTQSCMRISHHAWKGGRSLSTIFPFS